MARRSMDANEKRNEKVQVPLNAAERRRLNRLSSELQLPWAATFRLALIVMEREQARK